MEKSSKRNYTCLSQIGLAGAGVWSPGFSQRGVVDETPDEYLTGQFLASPYRLKPGLNTPQLVRPKYPGYPSFQGGRYGRVSNFAASVSS